jgi:hypothetical protein
MSKTKTTATKAKAPKATKAAKGPKAAPAKKGKAKPAATNGEAKTKKVSAIDAAAKLSGASPPTTNARDGFRPNAPRSPRRGVFSLVGSLAIIGP